MRQGNALRFVAALAVLSAAATLHAQCTPIVRSLSQASAFPNRVGGPIATDGSHLLVAKSDGTSGTPAIYVQLFDASLNSVSGERLIASAANGPAALFYNDAANEFGLFYRRTDATMVLQRIDTTGAAIGTPIVIPHSWSFNDEFDIAWDHGAAAYAIAHFVTGGPDMGLWLTMVSTTGTVISDLQVSVFLARPAVPRVTALPDGSVAVLWSGSSQATYVTLAKGSSVVQTEITERQVTAARIAASNNAILVIYSTPLTGGGAQLRSALLNASGAVTSPDAAFLNARGADIAPLSLQWVPAQSEWALVYSDSILGFNNFPGEVHLRRFPSLGATASDTFLSPDMTLNVLNAAFPPVFLNGGYVASIARIVSPAQGGDSYLVRLCPLIASFSVDSTVARPFTQLTFRATSSGGSPGYAYSWTFGDNDSATGAVVQHHYSANGTYTVTLTATDAAGATAVYKSTVLITDKVHGRAARH